jgi:hypothetical protein
MLYGDVLRFVNTHETCANPFETLIYITSYTLAQSFSPRPKENRVSNHKNIFNAVLENPPTLVYCKNLMQRINTLCEKKRVIS